MLAEEQELFSQTDLGQFDDVLALHKHRPQDEDAFNERDLALLYTLTQGEEPAASDFISLLGTTRNLLDGPINCRIFGLTRASFPSLSKESDMTWVSNTASWIRDKLNTVSPGLVEESSPFPIRITLAPRPSSSPGSAPSRKQPQETGQDAREAKITLRLNDSPARTQLFTERANPFSGTDCTAQRVFVRLAAEGRRCEVALSSRDSQLLPALGRSLRLSTAPNLNSYLLMAHSTNSPVVWGKSW